MDINFLSKGNIKTGACIFIHGNSLSAISFQKQLDGINDFPLVAIDIPGHGASPKSNTPIDTYCIPGYICALKKFIEVNEIQDFILVGHSLGGHIAIEASNEIKGLRGIVIFGTPPIGVPPAMDKAFLPNPSMGLIFQEHLNNEELKQLSDAFANNNDIKPFIIEEIKKTDGQARISFAQSVGEGRHKDELEIVNALKVPLLVMYAENDALVNSEYLKGINWPALWQNKIHIIKNSGHSPQLEQPEEFNKLIQDFYSFVFNQK